MPVRPEDFDASPLPRSGSVGPPLNGHQPDERRWFEKLSQRQLIWLLLAVSTVGLAVFAAEKPLLRVIDNLIHPNPPVIVDREKVSEEKVEQRKDVPLTPSRETIPSETPKAESTTSTDHSSEISAVTENTKPLHKKVPHKAPAMALQPDAQTQAQMQNLESQKAEEAAQQKQRSEEQAALEEQRQSALVNPLPPSAEPMGLNDVEIYVKLMSPISTRTSAVGDGISAQVLTAPYTGAIVQGRIASLRTDKNGKKAEITFQFETLTFRNTTYRIEADLKDLSNSHGGGNMDERGQLIGKSSRKKNEKVSGPGKGGVFGAAVRGAKSTVVGSNGTKETLFVIKLTAAADGIDLAPGAIFTLRVSDRIPH